MSLRACSYFTLREKIDFLWSWGESNSRPNIFAESFLHAYFFIICRPRTGKEQTNARLSWMVLSNRHSLRLQHPVFVFSRRRSMVTGEPAQAALMTT